MKFGFLSLAGCLSLIQLNLAQPAAIDSIKLIIRETANDTVRLLLLEKAANDYSEINPDSALIYATEIPVLARKLDLPLEEIGGMTELGYALLNMGNYPRALQTFLTTIALAENQQSEKNVLPARFPVMDDFMDRTAPASTQRLAKLSRVLHFTGILYANNGNYEKALNYYHTARFYAEQAKNLRVLSGIFNTAGRAYFSLQKFDSAQISLQKAYDLALAANYRRYLGSILLNQGRIHLALKKPGQARIYFYQALKESADQEYHRGVIASRLALSDYYRHSGQEDSSYYQIRQGLLLAHSLNAPDLHLRLYTSLADYFIKSGNSDSTVKYQSLIINLTQKLFNTKQTQQFQNIDFDAQQRQIEILAAKKEIQNRYQKMILLGILAIFFLLALFLWRINIHRKNTNALLLKQNKDIESAMSNLRSTQAQLIQSEKMASLGELTAGIAHEIQNPLNFVNNFSEINRELIEEIQEGRRKEPGGRQDTPDLQMLQSIKENQEKILHHGKRADAIVKSMLEHSRVQSGQKEPTDLNALCNEFLRLSYFGIRAKNREFNAEFELVPDPNLPGVEVVPQDMGRVLLNLINNAFYSVDEKSKKRFPGYKPKVIVSTNKVEQGIEIKVKDNGVGIPEQIRDKIFQPFFTTKPTGLGTGLGLSIAYDIVKAHGGSLKVDSKAGEGSEFIVALPI